MAKRITIILVCILTSLFGIIFSILAASGGIFNKFYGAAPLLSALYFLVGLLVIFSWSVFIAMCIGWVKNQPLAKSWVNYGTIAGVICIIFFTFFSLFVLPAILLAIYLRKFHLTQYGSVSHAN